MARLRRFLIVTTVLAALAGVGSSRALADQPVPPPCSPQSAQVAAVSTTPSILSSPHFDIWYNDTPGTGYVTETEAGDLGALAEQSYAGFAAQGFPTPDVDPSGKIDIYVIDMTSYGLSSEVCDGSFYFDSGTIGDPGEGISVGWDIFSDVENSFFTSPSYPGFGDDWLPAAAAQWAAAKADGYPSASLADVGPSDMSLDCWDDTWGTARCSTTLYENLGLSRWPFLEYLAERFGTLFIDEVLTDANAANSSYTGLANALVAHGTTFSDAFNAWTTAELTGSYSASVLQGRKPTAYPPVVSTGTKAGSVASVQVPVDHLATRYIEFTRGDGTTTGACYQATLSLSVTIPTGTLSKPTFYWTASGSTPVALSISGSTASASVPWDTCTWSGPVGLLSLPNASAAVNSATFVVNASMTVDLTQPVTPTLPPAGVSLNTPVVQVPSTDVAPTIAVFGPELLKLAAGNRQLRLIVQSSSTGSLQAAIGSVSLGSAGLRAGNNDVRFTIPESLVSALRRSAGTNLLTLTPVSSTGAATGQAVTRTVSIAPAKPAAKPKAKPKAKAKPKKPATHK